MSLSFSVVCSVSSDPSVGQLFVCTTFIILDDIYVPGVTLPSLDNGALRLLMAFLGIVRNIKRLHSIGGGAPEFSGHWSHFLLQYYAVLFNSFAVFSLNTVRSTYIEVA